LYLNILNLMVFRCIHIMNIHIWAASCSPGHRIGGARSLFARLGIECDDPPAEVPKIVCCAVEE